MIFSVNGQSRTRFGWNPPTTREDGTGYGAADHHGYEIGLSDPNNPDDGFRPHVGIPAGYDVTAWPLAELNIEQPGTYELALRTIDRDMRPSRWSAPFTFAADLAPPSPPTDMQLLA